MDNVTWVYAERKRDNYWTPPDGNMGNDNVRVTGNNRVVIEEQLALQAGNRVGSSQFNCQ